MERSIRRAELYTEDDSPNSSPEPINIDSLRTIEQFDFVHKALPTPAEVNAETNEDKELTFRLFSTSSGKDVAHRDDAIQTIRIKSPTPQMKEAGFVVPHRDASYYFTPVATNIMSSYASTAVSAADIHKLASIKWYGATHPWKVLDVPANGLTRAAKLKLDQAWTRLVPAEALTKHRRPGKQARIKMRTKLHAAKQRENEAKIAQQTQDIADREKKTRRNREKKAKKRLRDKAKKSTEQTAQHDGNTSASEADGES